MLRYCVSYCVNHYISGPGIFRRQVSPPAWHSLPRRELAGWIIYMYVYVIQPSRQTAVDGTVDGTALGQLVGGEGSETISEENLSNRLKWLVRLVLRKVSNGRKDCLAVGFLSWWCRCVYVFLFLFRILKDNINIEIYTIWRLSKLFLFEENKQLSPSPATKICWTERSIVIHIISQNTVTEK